MNEIPDWDDRMRSVKWIDVPQPAIDQNNPESQRPVRPARRKVIEADVEPAHQRIEEQIRQLDIYISAVTDYCRYKCSEFEIRYLDTAMLQTRVHEYVENLCLFFSIGIIVNELFRVTITNRGKVAFNYAWQVHMEDNQRPFTPMIDRDPPTPEPTDGPRKGQKGAGRSQTNISSTDSPGAQESSAAPSATRGKDKTGKDTGKATGKDGQTGSKAKGARSSIKSNVTAENQSEEKEPEDPIFYSEATNITDIPRGDSESSIRSPPSVMTDVGYVPFMIEPDTGTIAVGASQVFKIKFAPLDVNDYQARLTCW